VEIPSEIRNRQLKYSRSPDTSRADDLSVSAAIDESHDENAFETSVEFSVAQKKFKV